MNYYEFTYSDLNEEVKLKVLKTDTKDPLPSDNFNTIDYNENGDCILTLYATSKAQALYIGCNLITEVIIQSREEEEKEEKREDLILKSLRRG